MLDEYQLTLPRDRQQLLRRYHIIDFGHKVVGVGSVGLLAFVVLLQGRDENDLLVLQVKEAVPSVLEPFTGSSAFEESGERVVVGQQFMQAASDVFLGWIRGPRGRDFYVRQLRDMKYAPDPATLTESSLIAYAMVCGRTLARAHARAGDAVAISGYLGTSAKFDRAVRDFSHLYADQVAVDFAGLPGVDRRGRGAAGGRRGGGELPDRVSSSEGVSVVAAGRPRPLRAAEVTVTSPAASAASHSTEATDIRSPNDERRGRAAGRSPIARSRRWGAGPRRAARGPRASAR